MPELKFNGKLATLVPGSKLRGLAAGVHAPLSIKGGASGDIEFEFSLALKGSESISLVPLADEIRAAIEADWPHPRFGGMTLPLTRSVDKTGFSASWQLSKFSTNNSQQIQDCVAHDNCQSLTYGNLITVDLIQPVDIYVQADRSAKYGILFILLTFLSFFIFEVLRKMRIHPIQYGFVGFALALFYLLLVALSEHMQFAGAYMIAASVTLAVLTIYVTHIFKSRLAVAMYSFATGGLYALLYIIIQAEDFALLMGASLIFIVVALVMVLTRRIDWYAVGTNSAQDAQSKLES
jgi:inner membrane protein